MRNNDLKVSFYLRSNYRKTESGKSPIMIRISYHNETISLGSSGIEATAKDWSNGSFKGRTEEAIKGRTILDSIKTDISELFSNWISSNLQNIDLKKFREFYKSTFGPQKKNKMLDELMIEYRAKKYEKYQSGIIRRSSYQTKKSQIETLLKIIKENNIPITKINKDYADEIQIALLKQNKKVQTVNSYILILKSVCLYAVEQGLLTYNPLARYKMLKVTSTAIRYLTEEEIKAFLSVKTEGNMKIIQDIFEFMSLTSLAYSDVFKLKHSDIRMENNCFFIRIDRKKTESECVIPILRKAGEIIEKYSKVENETLFPYFSLMTFNNCLKRLAKIAGLKKRVTSHMARHTFGSMAVSHGVHLSAVQRCMGHKSIKTTEKYSVMKTDALYAEIQKLESI